MDLTADVLVVGGGMAGLVAGTLAARSGLHTILITRGHGATANSSGAIDILGYLPMAGTPTASPAEGLYGITSLYPFHPYSLLGIDPEGPAIDQKRVTDRVTAAVNWFVAEMSNTIAPYIGSLDKTLWPLSPVGTSKPTALLQATMNMEGMYEASEAVVLFVGIRGLPDFHSAMTAKAFLESRQTAGEGPRRVVNYTIDASSLGMTHEITPMVLAKLFDRDGVGKIASLLSAQAESTGVTHIVLPPILGLYNALSNLKQLETSLGVSVFELLGTPPSVPGTRLQLALEKLFIDSGGELFRGHEAISGRFEGDRLKTMHVRTPTRTLDIEANAFILSTGKFVGGGIKGTGEGLRESVLGLQVFDAHRMAVDSIRPQRLTERVSINERGHRLFGCGVGVDEILHPLDLDGKRYAENLFCAGAILAGHNWPLEKSGLGVALVTGHAAGNAVIEEVKG